MKQKTLLLFVFALMSCGYNNTEIPGVSAANSGQSDQGASGPDFASVKAQFFQPQCLRCHSAAGGNKGGINLETYANVSRFLNRAQSAVNSGVMPPAGPLPANIKSILNTWISAGAPEFASANPGNGGGISPPVNPNPVDPGNGDGCNDDGRINRANGYMEIQNGIYFDSYDQSLSQIQRRGGDDCD